MSRSLRSSVNIFAIVGLAVMGALWISVSVSEDVGYVQLVGNIVGPVGIITAIFLGLAFAVYAAGPSADPKKPHRTASTGTTTIFVLLAILLAWAGSRTELSYYIWLATAISAILAATSYYYSRPGRVAPRMVRYLLITGAFIAGALPGAILYFILTIVVSERYCQLTSSKCM